MLIVSTSKSALGTSTYYLGRYVITDFLANWPATIAYGAIYNDIAHFPDVQVRIHLSSHRFATKARKLTHLDAQALADSIMSE